MENKKTIIAWIVVLALAVFLVWSFLPAVTSYDHFVELCENTGGQVAIPYLACPWWNPDCREEVTICDCSAVGGTSFVVKDISQHPWGGCPS